MNIVIPESIKVGGHTFTILQDEDIDSDGRRATVCFKKFIIKIHPHKKATLKAEGFLHEILHIINAVYLNNQIDTEDIIEPLAEGLWQVFEQLNVEFDWSNIKEV